MKTNSDRPPLSKPSFTAPYYVKGLALGIPVYLVAVHLWTWVFAGAVFWGGHADFRQLYAAAKIVQTGQAADLYDYETQKIVQDKFVSPEEVALPFVSPAYEALAFSPLSRWNYRAAYAVMIGINLTALAACLLLLRPWTSNLRAVFVWLPSALALGFLPIAAALLQGQDSILLTLILVCTFVLLNRERDLAAGVVIALGLFKFSIVLPLVGLFLLWRRWRFLFGFALSGTSLLVISVWLTGIAEARTYLSSLLGIAGLGPASSGLAQYPVRLQKMADIHGLVFELGHRCLQPSYVGAVTILASVTVFAWTAWRGRSVKNASQLLLVAIPCAVLVSHHTYIHDLSVLFLPMALLFDHFLPIEALNLRARWIVGIAGLMLAAPVIESYAPDYFYLVSLAVGALLMGTLLAWDSTSGDKIPTYSQVLSTKA
jgi:hypothetical protein